MQGILYTSYSDTQIKPNEHINKLDLEQFLAHVERRALVMTEIATHSREDALDLVQESMMAFVTKYSERPRAEWTPLFYRILQNRTRDWYRKTAVRNKWKAWLGFADDDSDPIQSIPDPHSITPDQDIHRDESREAIANAVSNLPLRQQQAFMLRVWEGMNVANTAKAMGCSQGSVKTHLSRAMNALRGQLQEYR